MFEIKVTHDLSERAYALLLALAAGTAPAPAKPLASVISMPAADEAEQAAETKQRRNNRKTVTEQPVGEQGKPTAEKNADLEITHDTILKLVADIVKDGSGPKAKAILQSYNLQKVSQIPAELLAEVHGKLMDITIPF